MQNIQSFQQTLTPEEYTMRFYALPGEHQAYYYHPAYYANWYYENIIQASNQKSKLSRNQKRREKKKKLKEEYEAQKREIGDWVKLQRKDLIQDLKKIEEKETLAKQKKKEKFKHLIQIHKEVYKHSIKKNKGTIQNKKNGNFRVKKKKPSYLKKMKKLFEQKKRNPLPSIYEEVEDDGFVTESDQQKQQKKQSPLEPVEIEYKMIGKLTNQKYNQINLRQWVDHCPSQKLDDEVLKIINRLAYKQAIKKVYKPEKAKKLIVAGLHECKRTVWTKLDKKRSKMIILALNIDRNNFKGGIDDQIQQVLEYAFKEKVPVVHASNRAKLGRAFTGKFGPRITMISIVNYEGYQDMMDIIMEEWKLMRMKYDQI